jgi:Cutinase
MNSNIGVWVGPQFQAALKSSIPSVAFQGVDPTAYKADLSGYLSQDGGSNDGASSMAKAVIDYAAECPTSAIVLAGWR